MIPIVDDLLHLVGAYLLTLPVGWAQEREGHRAGIRTMPIVAMAACSLTMLATSMAAGPDAISRVLQGLVTGVGFVGAGAILKSKQGVTGTAGAASIFSVGIIGACVGFKVYHLAVALAVMNLLTLLMLRPLKERINEQEDEE